MIDYENLKKANASFLEEIKTAINRVVDSGWFVLGPEVENFENEFSNHVGVPYCVGVANGLDALTLSIKALDLPPGSDILVASNTYIATILAIIEAGHHPVLVEPNIRTFNIDSSLLSSALTRKTKAICITHLYGKSCKMDDVLNFVQEHGLYLIEDCAQSHSASFKGRQTGAFGISGCFSFYPTKNLGAFGDAGAIVTSDNGYAEKLRHLRNYGSRQKYVNEYIGFNSRLDEIQAAILRVKLKYIGDITEHKRKISDVYFDNLPDWLVLPERNPDYFDVFHIFAVLHEERNSLKQYLMEKGVKTEIHYPIPPHKQKAMAPHIVGEYPIADFIHDRILSLPISFGTTVDEALRVCEEISAFKG